VVFGKHRVRESEFEEFLKNFYAIIEVINEKTTALQQQQLNAHTAAIAGPQGSPMPPPTPAAPTVVPLGPSTAGGMRSGSTIGVQPSTLTVAAAGGPGSLALSSVELELKHAASLYDVPLSDSPRAARTAAASLPIAAARS
jgi:hypothetical protein